LAGQLHVRLLHTTAALPSPPTPVSAPVSASVSAPLASPGPVSPPSLVPSSPTTASPIDSMKNALPSDNSDQFARLQAQLLEMSSNYFHLQQKMLQLENKLVDAAASSSSSSSSLASSAAPLTHHPPAAVGAFGAAGNMLQPYFGGDGHAIIPLSVQLRSTSFGNMLSPVMAEELEQIISQRVALSLQAAGLSPTPSYLLPYSTSSTRPISSPPLQNSAATYPPPNDEHHPPLFATQPIFDSDNGNIGNEYLRPKTRQYAISCSIMRICALILFVLH
jgi:hypothetical protein